MKALAFKGRSHCEGLGISLLRLVNGLGLFNPKP